jgi:hypothetical protein
MSSHGHSNQNLTVFEGNLDMHICGSEWFTGGKTAQKMTKHKIIWKNGYSEKVSFHFMLWFLLGMWKYLSINDNN